MSLKKLYKNFLHYAVKAVPNVITFTNLILGFFSIKLAFEGAYKMAVTFIILSMFLDFLDGKAARKLKAVSSLGRELDSLSDIVSFGVAPSILIWIIFPFQPNLLGISLVFFLACGAYRLARFNLKGDKAKKAETDHFSGFPITAAGGLLALMSLYKEILPPTFLFCLIILLSISMVSNIPFISLKYLNKFKTDYIPFMLFFATFIFSVMQPSILTVILSLYFLSGIFLMFYMGMYQDTAKDRNEWH